jgi:hypothetical protein
VIVLLLALAPGIAAAQPAKKTAARHRQAANTAFELSDYGRAIEEYKLAYELAPDPRLFYNLGLSHLKRYEISRDPPDLVQARDYFNRFLGLMPIDKAKSKEKKKIAQLRKLAKDHLDKLSALAESVRPEVPPAPTATVAVAPPPPPIEPPPPPIEPPPPVVAPSPFPVWAVLLGAAGATGIAAAVTGALAVGDNNDAYDAALAEDYALANAEGSRARRFGYATDGLLIGTALLTGVGLWLLFD